jgi:hypothetical protein
MKKHVVGAFALAAAALLAQLAPLRADAAPKPVKVFILAGQSNMDGQASVSTIRRLRALRYCTRRSLPSRPPAGSTRSAI